MKTITNHNGLKLTDSGFKQLRIAKRRRGCWRYTYGRSYERDSKMTLALGDD